MCDISQFVIVVPILDEFSTILTWSFIQHLCMRFGIFYYVILDYDSSPLNGIFIAMRQNLNFNYHMLANHNYKDLTIVLLYPLRVDVLTMSIPINVVAGYMYNSSPINGNNMYSEVSRLLIVKYIYQPILIYNLWSKKLRILLKLRLTNLSLLILHVTSNSPF